MCVFFLVKLNYRIAVRKKVCFCTRVRREEKKKRSLFDLFDLFYFFIDFNSKEPHWVFINGIVDLRVCIVLYLRVERKRVVNRVFFWYVYVRN